MTSIERAEQQYERAVSAAQGRHRALVQRAQDEHDAAVRKADATHQLALQAATDKLEDAKQKANIALPRVLRDAEEAFDKACRKALGVADVVYLHSPGPRRLELRTSVGRPPLAVASHQGSGQWLFSTDIERRWLGSAQAARIELWRYAASLPAAAVAS